MVWTYYRGVTVRGLAVVALLLLWPVLALSYTFDPTVLNIPSGTYGLANEPCETPSGTDQTLTTGSAWESTLEGATPGRRYFLQAGTYTTTTLTIAQGSSGNPITIKPYNCAAVTLNTVVQPGSYTVLAGLTIKAVNFTRGAIVTGAIVRNNTLRSNGSVPNGVLRFGDTTINTLIQGNDIAATGAAGEHDHTVFVRDAVGTNNMLTQNKFANTSSGGEDLFQLNNWAGTWNICRNWFGANSSEDHIDVKASQEGAGTATLSIWENYFDGSALTGGSGVGSILIQGDQVNFNYVADVKGNYIHQSPKAIYHRVVPPPAVPNQDGRKLDFRWNVVNASNTVQFAAQVEAHDATFENNTFLRGNFRTTSNGFNPGNCVVRNNIFYQSNFQDSAGIDTCSHNTFFNTTGTAPSPCPSTRTTDPLFINAASDWALRAESLARGAGSDGLDMGAYGPPGVDFVSNLEMRLKFDEGTGTTAQDSTIHNHDGTLGSGASWGASKVGASASTFDGTTAGVVTVPGLLTTPPAITLALWMKRSAFPTSEGELLSLGNLVLLRQSATTLLGRYDSGGSQIVTSAFQTLGTTAWHHIAYTVAPGRQRLYLNGALVASTNNAGGITYTGGGANTVLGGHGALSTGFRFQGSLDDVRVYTRELTSSDIVGLAAYSEPPPLSVQITSPVSGPSYSTDTTPLTTLAGQANSPTGVTGITWACPTCTPTSGPATCTPACGPTTTSTTWVPVTSPMLAAGSNDLTVTATDASGTQNDTLTVTYTPVVVNGGAACTHYAAHDAVQGKPGTIGEPLRVIDFWAVATPGKVLCLKDGTYNEGNDFIKPPATFAGTASQPITIRALNDGKAHITGGESRPVHLTGRFGILEGVNISGGDNATLGGVDADDWVVRRVVVWSNNDARSNDRTIISIHGQRLVLEDWAAFGKARKAFQAGKDGNLGRRVLRGWSRFEECPICQGGNPTNSFEIGYDETHVLAFNNLSTRHEVGVNTSPEMAFNMFSTTNTHIKGHIAYVMPSYNYASPRAIHIYPTAGSHPGTTNTSNSTITDSVGIIAPGHSGFATKRGYKIDGTPGSGNVATNVVGIAGLDGECGGSWSCNDMKNGRTVADAIAPATSIWEAVPGICKRYALDGTLTTEGLWPGGVWPMNQRISDALALSGRARVNVTSDIVSLFGPMPAACTSGVSAETCTPPRVGTPPLCSCPAGTVEPLCEVETPPVTCPPDCPTQDVFVVAPATATPPGADSNACTLEAPCLTIDRARSLMTPGDVLYLQPGTYSGSGNRIATSTGAFPSGNDWSTPTRIAAYAGTVILQQNAGTVITLNNPTTDRYLVFDGLTVDGVSTPTNDTQGLVVAGGAHHIKWQNGTIRNTHFSGLSITDASAIEIASTTIHGSTHGSGATVTGVSDSVTLDGVTLHTNAVHGLNAAHSGLSNLTVRNSIAHHNGSTGFQLRASNLLAANLLTHTNALGLRLLSGAEAARMFHITSADNTGNEVQIDATATGTLLTNVLAVGGIADNGTGTVQLTNYTSDPGFVGGGNYHLALDTSPAIDAGTCLPGVVDVALDSVARPQPPGGACDIGAYEQVGEGVAPVPTPGPLSARPYSARMFFVP